MMEVVIRLLASVDDNTMVDEAIPVVLMSAISIITQADSSREKINHLM
jgi:hypothetical protein